MTTKDQQVSEVVEGLGLGLIALGVTSVTSSKLDLEFAFSHSWRRWDHADEYPSIGRAAKPDNVFWIGVTKSERRNMAAVVWKNLGNKYELRLRHNEWTPEEIAGLVGKRPLSEWVALATPYREWLHRKE
ncbi:MAG: hypothetical protein ACJ72E_09590 [Marmoricola sp.]